VLQEIQKIDFRKYKKLFKNIFYILNSLVVINGDNQGRMWVNQTKNPKTGVLVDNENSIYLVGDYSNPILNKEIAYLIFNEIFPEASKTAEKYENTWVIYYDQDKWKQKIESDMNIVDFLPLKRKYFMLKKPASLNWRKFISSGYNMKFLNKEFLERKELKNFKEITDYINKSWRSIEDYVKRGFGFCLVKNQKIITSWCISDWVSENKSEIGVGTDADFRKKGHATLVVMATIQYCLDKNIEVSWHCSSHNIASQRTAEKVGFNLEKEYEIALGSFDKAYILWENTWYRGLFLDQPEEAIGFMKRFLEVKEPSAFQLFNYGKILVRADKLKEAITTFSKVIDKEPDFINVLKDALFNAKKIKTLKKTEGWNMLIKKLELT
jgi:RimJ/RimL family protein N-acetyltransferase